MTHRPEDSLLGGLAALSFRDSEDWLENTATQDRMAVTGVRTVVG